MSKMRLPRLFLITAAVGASSLYYLSRNAEINRIRQLKISFDMLFNVGVRAVPAAIVGDFIGRKLFVNHKKQTAHRVASNEIKKMMRTFPNARPMLMPHQKPNSFYYAM